MKITPEIYINRAAVVHGYKYNYSKTNYINMHNPIEIECPIHGPFIQLPNNHLRYGCKQCGGTSKLTTEQFVNNAKQIYGTLYDYNITTYIDMKTKVEIICSKHGPFSQLPGNHLKHGCKKCSNERKAMKQRLPSDIFIARSKLIHNNKYDYSLINYSNAHTNVTIICPIHGEFQKTPDKHMQGCGCSKCATKSLPEINWLNSFGIVLEMQKIINFADGTRAKVDGYDHQTNTIYEYNGKFWHGHPDLFDPNDIHPVSKKVCGNLYLDTLLREIKLRELGYNLIVKWE